MCVCVCVESCGRSERGCRRWVRVNVYSKGGRPSCHTSPRVHTPTRTTPVVVAPPIHPSCVFTDSRVVCHYSCLVLCSCGCRCPWHCVALALSLSLSLPPPFPQHTHAGDLIHRVYDHLASPRHRGCVAMNTMRVGVTIPTGWPPFSFGSAERTSSFYDERVGGRRRSGVDIYAYI